MVVGDDDPAAVGRTLESVGGQTSRRWSLTAVTAQGRLDEVRTLVRSALVACGTAGAAGSSGPRRTARSVTSSGRASTPTRGSPRALIFPGDLWAPDAVALLGAALTPGGVVYADEDEVGGRRDARTPPASSPTTRPSSS